MSLTACQTSGGLVPGTGFELVTLNRPAAKAVVKLDRVAAEKIASNRRACLRLKGCKKGYR